MSPYQQRSRGDRQAPAAGFTLLELLVTVTLIALVFAIVAPNLGAFLPAAKLDSTCSQLVSRLDWLRSEARIQGKRMVFEIDLQKARWRLIYPPEQQLTRDQDAWTLEEQPDHWRELEPGVQFLGAGDPNTGLVRAGKYQVVFDANGFTGDQVIAIKLEDDPKLVWSIVLHGLSGRCRIERDTDGREYRPVEVREGAF